MPEDEIERNRRYAKALFQKGKELAKAGWPHIRDTIDAAGRDLERGKTKAADRKLAKVENEASQIAESPRSDPQTIRIMLQVVDETRHDRREIEKRQSDVVDAQYRVVE